ncbi:esterase B1-like isoform X2 [Anthonomus grandis grandis]|nr:esterase B1-like isoform X2 [Anthonomus grandis grandis]
MFWIHGGAYTKGSGGTELYEPDYFVEKKVVLVTINYRLGPLGFLALSDPSVGVPGNAGLKDTVMALKWVKRNISQFCGNPNNVTIFGESAGGASVHFLILSPMAKGLFHKAIMQSGCALNTFTRGKSYFSHKLAHRLGIDSNNEKFILSELQKVPIKELFAVSQKIWDRATISNIRPFCPVVEPKGKEPAFLTEEPLEILKSGRYNKVPMIMGYNSLEGIFVYIYLMRINTEMFLSDETLVPNSLNLRIGSTQYKKVCEEVRQMYGLKGDEDMWNRDVLEKAIKIYTHNYFMVDICRSAMLHASHKIPVWFYRFNLDTDLNFLKKVSGIEMQGAAHADDLPYLFPNVLIGVPDPGTLEYQLAQKITKLWTNFAKFGTPTPNLDNEIGTKWHPMKPGKYHYLSMENEGFKMSVNPEKEYVDFWNVLYDSYQMLWSKL